jgi:hypothetical protein
MIRILVARNTREPEECTRVKHGKTFVGAGC